jgi:hypothetical protein
MKATTRLESMPPLRNAPRGTSLMRCEPTVSRVFSSKRSIQFLQSRSAGSPVARSH